MTDKSRPEPPRDHTPDRDLNIKAIVGFSIALAVATAIAAIVSWWLSKGLRDSLEGRDPTPPTLIEAQMPYRPPSPNLQTDPATELAAARAEEAAILSSYQWTDPAGTLARVPIERAMELLLETRPGGEAFGIAAGGEEGDAP